MTQEDIYRKDMQFKLVSIQMNLRERFEKETGKKPIQYGGVPELGYVEMLESMLEWIPVEIKLPEKGQNVFAHYKNSFGKDRIIRSKYLRKYQEEASDDELDFAEYSEEHDENFWPEGWYEQIDNWGDYSAVAVVEGEIDYWLPLPPLPEDV
jgi:hypothetical protein